MSLNAGDRKKRIAKPPKGLEDYDCGDMPVNEHLQCKNCEIIFPNKKKLNQHQRQCKPRPEPEETPQSFFRIWEGANNPTEENPGSVDESNDKILPPSQPLEPISPPSKPKSYAAIVVSPPMIQLSNANEEPASAGATSIRATRRSTATHATSMPTASSTKKQKKSAASGNSNTTTRPRTKATNSNRTPSSSMTEQTETAANLSSVSASGIITDHLASATTKNTIESIYGEITQWRRNLFKLPKGNLGKQFVDNKTSLLNQWAATNKEEVLMLLMIMPNLLLQRTSKKCKARENKDHLRRRLEMWDQEKFTELMEEGKCIQSRLSAPQNRQSDEELVKMFRSQMLRGNVNAALRLLNKTNNKGILPINNETIKQLHEKHPQGEPLHQEMLLSGPKQNVHPVIFDDINGDLVIKIAMKMKGAAGPSCFDSDDWKTILVSCQFGSSSSDLCDAIARVAKVLCTEDRTEGEGATALIACRLIPLDKDPGLRPIGIGEVLRRIIGKLVVYVLKGELQEDAGELQMCVSQEGGCEAGVHAMCDIFQDDETHGIIQVDANNAFNTINRNVFLHNIQIICPEISTFIRNCYLKPARLFVVGGIEIKSEEGTTQGDPTAMPAYALGIAPLLMSLTEPNRPTQVTNTMLDEQVIQLTNETKARQAAYADDLTGSGTIDELKRWWDMVIELGPFIGYYAKPSKSWLIVKPSHVEYATRVFAGSGLQITTEGQRHLGAVIGSAEFKEEYVTEKIDMWISELEMLEKVVKIEPHIAYCAFVFGIQHRYTYLLRTIPGISDNLKRLDTAIDTYLIKHLCNNHTIGEVERTWISLPPRLGGLGIRIASEISETYFNNSRKMTRELVSRIVHQHDKDYVLPPVTKPAKVEIQEEKKKNEEDKVNWLKQQFDPEKLKLYEAITEKGSSNWLNTLPLKDHDFYLSKQEFWDAVQLRYGFPLTRLPQKCVCSENFSTEHALTCKKGGFVTIRHNSVRDFTADLLSEVCNDVAVEPLLAPLTGESFKYKTANKDNLARLDVSARGVWMKGSRAFFDVRVFNPLAPSYNNQTLKAAHRSNEAAKKREYGERIINVEHGSFTPLVFSSFGGMSVECTHFYNRLSDKISEKRDISVSKGRAWIRTKLSFSLLRMTLLCIRGSRTKRQHSTHEPISETNIQAALIDSRLECH